MLQRIHDSVGPWVAAVILGLIAFGFIFWGIDFSQTSSATFAAKVNGETIPLTEFDRELQSRQNQYQQTYRTELTEDMRRQLRSNVIDSLVAATALRQRVESRGYRVSDSRLTNSIRSIQAFQVDGKFSMDVYRALLSNQNLTPTQFEQLQRQDLEVRELQDGISNSTFLTPSEFRRYIELYNQTRDVGYAMFDVQPFLSKVNVDDDAISEHYENNKASYKTTETVDMQYIELSLADIAAKVEVTDEALHEYYDKVKDRYTTAEQRHVAHILIAVNSDRTDEQAKALAEQVLKRVQGGEDFAKVAAEVSDDTGSKTNGGDLGWIARGTLGDEPFETAVFGMKDGEITGPVKTDFGYHVIKLEGIRPGGVKPFEEVRAEITTDYKNEKAEDKFYDEGNQLEQKAFDAYNELASVAAALQVPLKTAMGFPRTGDPKLFENSAPIVQAAFSDDLLESGKNSSPIQLTDDDVVVLRVTAHHPSTIKPLEAVHDQIKQELTRAKAVELAEQAADAFLAAVDKGDDPAKTAEAQNGKWQAPKWVQRTDATVPTQVLSAAFGLEKPAEGTTVRKKVALASGDYAVIALDGVKPGDPMKVPQTERDQRQRQLADQSAYAELTSYAGEVRSEAKVRIPDSVLEPQF